MSERLIEGARSTRSSAVGGLTARNPSKASFQHWLASQMSRTQGMPTMDVTSRRLAGRLLLPPLLLGLGMQLAVRHFHERQCIAFVQHARICMFRQGAFAG
jgi:hypothetical protein